MGFRVSGAGTVLIVVIATLLLVESPSSTPLGPPRASAAEGGNAAAAARRADADRKLIMRSTGYDAELRETVPITRRARRGRRVVMSLPLPRLRRHDRIRVGGEIGTSTTCVFEDPRCIGRIYGFDPKLSARIVIGAKPTSASPTATRAVSPPTRLSCGQTRPNRNHHCPLVIENGSISVGRPGRLPCAPRHCRLNLVLSAHHPRARGGEKLVVGGDRPDGSVEQDKGRLSAVIIRAAGRRLKVHDYATRLRRHRSLETAFSNGHEVIYSRKLTNLRRGDVLVVRARQRSALPGREPYFISNQVIVSSSPAKTRPTPFSKRTISGRSTVTQTNGFNCTAGPSAFSSPCKSRKFGIVRVLRTPNRPLFVNLVSRTFPLIAQQARGGYPPVRILRGGLAVQRLRAQRPAKRRTEDGALTIPGGSGGSGGSGQGPLLPLPPLPIIGGGGR